MTEKQGTFWDPAATPALLSRLARLHIAKKQPPVQKKIITAVARGMLEGDFGRTCEEIELEYGLKHQTVSACITAMHTEPAPILRESGYKRFTVSDNHAIVWTIITAEPEHERYTSTEQFTA